MFLALAWSAFGTALLILAGVNLPGLEFKNQRVEAAYRKELVFGEDNAERAARRLLRLRSGKSRRRRVPVFRRRDGRRPFRVSPQRVGADAGTFGGSP